VPLCTSFTSFFSSCCYTVVCHFLTSSY
jgi:hypothetical protein